MVLVSLFVSYISKDAESYEYPTFIYLLLIILSGHWSHYASFMFAVLVVETLPKTGPHAHDPFNIFCLH